jgi:hypothetical protein
MTKHSGEHPRIGAMVSNNDLWINSNTKITLEIWINERFFFIDF